MWVRAAAIRPVPGYAVIDSEVMSRIGEELAGEDADATKGDLDRAFARFEESQGPLSDFMTEVLAQPFDQEALALGYFLAIAVWLGFDRAFGRRLGRVPEDAIRATQEAVALEEELRAAHGEEPLDLDDVVAIEQPGVMRFVNEHVDVALEIGDGHASEVDVDDVHAVYRAIVVLTLALSHAVEPEKGVRPREMMA